MTHTLNKDTIPNKQAAVPSYSNVAFLHADEWENVQNILSEPSEPNEALKQLFKRGYQVVNKQAR